MDGLGVKMPVRAREFSPPKMSQPSLRPNQPPGSVGSFLGVKRPEHKVYHSPPPSVEVKNE